MSALRVNSGTWFNPVIPEPRTRRLHLQVRFRRIRFVAPVTRAESGNSLQGWEVDETIEERSGQVNFGCLYNAKGVSPWVAECSSPF
jgi:hypothetical protein